MHNVLSGILENTRREVEERKTAVPFETLIERVGTMPETADFGAALRGREVPVPACIAEIKKASPSKGTITKDFSPERIAREYAAGGAAALSVLTDERYFKGRPEYVALARQHSRLPVLRKDFIVDEYQVFESRVIGADAILLIVAALSDAQLRAYLAAAADLSLAVLVECHTKEEIDRALDAGAVIIGVNNRDLTTFVTDISVSLKLKRFIPNDRIAVSESGIRNFHTVEQLAQAGFDAVLVGEHLMAQTDRTKALKELLGGRR